MSDVVGIISAVVAVSGLLFTLTRIMIGNLKSELSARDTEQEKQINKLQTDHDQIAKSHNATRSELHADYAKRVDLESVERGLREDVNKVFDVVNGVSRDLNQMIGEFRAWNQTRSNTRPDSGRHE